MTHAIDRNDLVYAEARARSRIIGARPAPLGGRGVINPHVTRFALADGTGLDVFHVKPVYYEDRAGFWRPLKEIAVHHGNRNIALLPGAMERASWRFLAWLMKRQRLLGSRLSFRYPYGAYWGIEPLELARLGTLTVYPDPAPETTTVDGYARNQNAVWATCHDAATGSTANDTNATMLVESDNGGGANFIIDRAFALFDTSPLPPNAAVLAGTMLSLYVTAKVNADNDGDDWISTVQSSPASNTAITTADFDQCGAVTGPTEGSGRIDVGSISTSAYNDFMFNDVGKPWINKAGVTKLGSREGHDAGNSAAAGENRITSSTAEVAGTTQDPKLFVSYSEFTGKVISLEQATAI